MRNIMRKGFLLLGVLLAIAAWAAVEPAEDTLFTSTRYVTGIQETADGTLWVSTHGGVLRRGTDGRWTKYTVRDGLPSNEVLSLALRKDAPVAQTPVGAVIFTEGAWRATTIPPVSCMPGEICAAEWGGQRYVSAMHKKPWEGWQLQIYQGDKLVQELSYYDLTRNVGGEYAWFSFVSVLLPRPDALWVGTFGGANLLTFDGKQWKRLSTFLPKEAREVTALGGTEAHLWVGTRRAGLWEYTGGKWTQHLQPAEPDAHNIQSLAWYHGQLYAGTLEDGLLVKQADGWQHYARNPLSTDAPRQMVVFKDTLYARHGGGIVDALTGSKWSQDVCAKLPRKEVSALASDNTRLYAAQWGGWSEFDGTTWTHYFKEPGLQGAAVIGLFPDGDTLWVATQQRGLGAYRRATKTWTWYDERAGMPDDWIRCLAHAGTTRYAGTFVGGLARQVGERWSGVPGLTQGEITALAVRDTTLYAATRAGLFVIGTDGAARAVTCPCPEVQALLPTPAGLWVGTRTGLVYLTGKTLAGNNP